MRVRIPDSPSIVQFCQVGPSRWLEEKKRAVKEKGWLVRVHDDEHRFYLQPNNGDSGGRFLDTFLGRTMMQYISITTTTSTTTTMTVTKMQNITKMMMPRILRMGTPRTTTATAFNGYDETIFLHQQNLNICYHVGATTFDTFHLPLPAPIPPHGRYFWLEIVRTSDTINRYNGNDYLFGAKTNKEFYSNLFGEITIQKYMNNFCKRIFNRDKPRNL